MSLNPPTHHHLSASSIYQAGHAQRSIFSSSFSQALQTQARSRRSVISFHVLTSITHYLVAW